METTRTFILDGDRYRYDFGECSFKLGWAQVDSSQDAWYFGMWANPATLTIVTYCEGDETIQRTDDPKEFCDELRRVKAWNEDNGHTFAVDTMCDPAIEAGFRRLHLSDLFHQGDTAPREG